MALKNYLIIKNQDESHELELYKNYTTMDTKTALSLFKNYRPKENWKVVFQKMVDDEEKKLLNAAINPSRIITYDLAPGAYSWFKRSALQAIDKLYNQKVYVKRKKIVKSSFMQNFGKSPQKKLKISATVIDIKTGASETLSYTETDIKIGRGVSYTSGQFTKLKKKFFNYKNFIIIDNVKR